MARRVGSKNKNNNSIDVTNAIKEYWSKPEQIDKMHAALDDILTNGGYRDKLSVVTQIWKYIAIPAEKQLESDTLVEASMSKADVIEAIKSLKK